MLRTSTVLLKPTLEEEHELVKLADASSALWNIANYERRKAFFGHEKQPTYAGQCKSLKSTEPFKTIYSGRAVLSDWVYQTKKVADRQSKLPRHKHTSRNINTTYRKRTRRLRHSINAMLRDAFERLEASDVGHLAVGDLSGIREAADHGDSGNQKLHNFWAFNMILARIYELGEEHGITVAKVSERNTSKTCCLCGKAHGGRIERGLMVCKETHRSINADVNGAVNIMQVAVNRPLSSVLSTLPEGASGSGLMAQPLLLRWNYNGWS